MSLEEHIDSDGDGRRGVDASERTASVGWVR